jgi:molybdopterin synthase catalytic subunit
MKKVVDKPLFEVIDKPINVQEVIDKVVRREAGAVTTFIGTVREITKGKRTLYLEYQAYETMAVKMLEKIGTEIKEKWPEAKTAITQDIAVVIAVSTPHRKDAYDANEYAIERIKQIVPIWKKENWEDGDMWIGNQLEQTPYPTGKPEMEDAK